MKIRRAEMHPDLRAILSRMGKYGTRHQTATITILFSKLILSPSCTIGLDFKTNKK
jgi:hypothetical protein